MSTDDFAVRDALKGLTTAIPDEDDVLHTIRRRTIVRDRRRRAGGAALLIGAVALGGILTVWRPDNRQLKIYDDGSIVSILLPTTQPEPIVTTTPPSVVESTTTSPQPTPETATTSPTSPTTADTPPSATTVVAPPPTTRRAPTPAPPEPVTVPPTSEPTSEPTTIPATAAPTTPTTPQPTSTSTSTTTTTVPTTVPAPIRKTRVTGGGSVTVESVGTDQLVVIDAAPAPGYTVTVEQASGTSVLVIFAGGENPTTYRISATFDGTRIPFTVVKESTPPPTTVPGGG